MKALIDYTDIELDAMFTREVGHMAWHRTMESYIEAIELARIKMPKSQPCTRHSPPLSYVAQIEKNDLMSKKGAKQIHCNDCGIWYWKDEF